MKGRERLIELKHDSHTANDLQEMGLFCKIASILHIAPVWPLRGLKNAHLAFESACCNQEGWHGYDTK